MRGSGALDSLLHIIDDRIRPGIIMTTCLRACLLRLRVGVSPARDSVGTLPAVFCRRDPIHFGAGDDYIGDQMRGVVSKYNLFFLLAAHD